TISHIDHVAARTNANGLPQPNGTLDIYGGLFGLGQPIQKPETRSVGNDTQLVTAVDGAAVPPTMKRFLPPVPAPAPTSAPGRAGALGSGDGRAELGSVASETRGSLP